MKSKKLAIDELYLLLARELEKRRTRAKPGKRSYWIRTDATCTDKKIGRLYTMYARDRLKPATKARFEDHMFSCMYCAVAVLDFWSLEKMVRLEKN